MNRENTNGNVLTPTRTKSPDPHASVTPPNAAEQFFLPSLKTSDISAFALAAAVRINSEKKSSSHSIRSSVAAESFYASCQGDTDSQQLNSDEEDVFLSSQVEEVNSNHVSADELISEEFLTPPQDSRSKSISFKLSPVLPMARRTKQSKKKNSKGGEVNEMSVKSQSSSSPTLKSLGTSTSPTAATPAEVAFETQVLTPLVTPKSEKLENDAVKKNEYSLAQDEDMPVIEIPTTVSMDYDTVEEEEEEKEEQVVAMTTTENRHFDIGTHVYEQAKGLWLFGKEHVPIVQFFLAAAESAAEKVLGGKLQDVDTNIIQPILLDFDRVYLDPLVDKMLQMVVPLFKKVGATINAAPVVPQLLRHVGISLGGNKKTCITEDEDV